MPLTPVRRVLLISFILTLAATTLSVPGIANARPVPAPCVDQELRTVDVLVGCVGADAAVEHLKALQAIADANGGDRSAGTGGYNSSADYVAALLRQAGMVIERQSFDFSRYDEHWATARIDGSAIATHTVTYSATGSVVDGNVVPVDLALGEGNTSTSACTPEDFDALDFSGDADIALAQRGGCTFAAKAINAVNAGAEALVIFNQGNTEDRRDIIGAALGDDVVGIVDIPVLDVAYADGVAMLAADSVSVSAITEITTSKTENIIADLPGANPDNVVMAGAHLDSVADGAGMQDNGSGAAALLTIALTLAENRSYVPQNTLRFAWWGAEESGLVGSNNYVFHPDFGLTDDEHAALAAYLNFDMIASPNFVYGVYDSDESTFKASAPVPEGSSAIEALFEAYYSDNDIGYEDTKFSGRSDYQAFIRVGVPSSGLFTGAEGLKTAEQASIWGGTAGERFDPCYHEGCDTIANVSTEALGVNVDAIAYAIFHLAASTEAINGVVGASTGGRTADDVQLDGPRGTFLQGGGMAMHGHVVS